MSSWTGKYSFFLDNNWWNLLAKPITNDFKNKGKYNMILYFCKNDLTPYF
jgi:hypothetical protein